MADLSKLMIEDPTLVEMNKQLELKNNAQMPRAYVGMSQIGDECSRKTWYSFRWCNQNKFDATSIKRFDDGHRTEDLMAERLRMIPGVFVYTIDPNTKEQFRYTDHDGHFSGHCDGKIIGLLQAPKKLHIWENKATAEKNFTKLQGIKADVGEKQALKKWNVTYYGQAQLYMHYEGTDRHYTTVCTPGGRNELGLRTEYDVSYALGLKAKASRIINSHAPLEKISEKSDWFQCRMCPSAGICHGGDMPLRNCRTCTHSSPIDNGRWHCSRWGKDLTLDEQWQGCPAHIYLPSLVPGEPIKTTDTSITYKMKDGSHWTDGEDKKYG